MTNTPPKSLKEESIESVEMLLREENEIFGWNEMELNQSIC